MTSTKYENDRLISCTHNHNLKNKYMLPPTTPSCIASKGTGKNSFFLLVTLFLMLDELQSKQLYGKENKALKQC